MAVGRRTGAECAVCGLAAGNSRGVPVLRHSLQRTVYRNGKTYAVRVGTMALCDLCIRDYGRPPRRLRARADELGFRS
jgi:hypothetical protein